MAQILTNPDQIIDFVTPRIMIEIFPFFFNVDFWLLANKVYDFEDVINHDQYCLAVPTL